MDRFEAAYALVEAANADSGIVHTSTYIAIEAMKVMNNTGYRKEVAEAARANAADLENRRLLYKVLEAERILEMS